MIAGRADENRAVISLTLRALDGRGHETLDFTLDTGFDGFLTVPGPIIASLRLPQVDTAIVTLANGDVVGVPVHSASVDWDNALRDVRVLATGGRPLLGTRMLAGHEVIVRFVAGGDVTVRPLV